ncbi:MAG: hypothetical protein ABJG78_06275 [Cyclobacteriaceae bacterium]
MKRTGNVFTSFALSRNHHCMSGPLRLVSIYGRAEKERDWNPKSTWSTFSDLFHSLSSNFLKLIAISLVVAFPLGWYAMKRWLQNYEYGIDVTWNVLLISGSIILIISVVTISYEIVRAVKMNPAETLHSE